MENSDPLTSATADTGLTVSPADIRLQTPPISGLMATGCECRAGV